MSLEKVAQHFHRRSCSGAPRLPRYTYEKVFKLVKKDKEEE